MKKIGLVVFVIVLVGVGWWFVMSRPDTNNSQPGQLTDQATPQNQAPTEKSETTTNSSGQYLDYTEEAVSSTEGTKILFFHASWCPQCRKLENDIKKSGLPNGVTVFKVDFDDSTELKKKYGVTLQTTLVLVDDNSKLVKKYVAYDNPSVQSLKENLL